MIISSTRTLVTLLRPWIRRLTIIISAWWLRTSSKFTWEKVKRQPENGQLLSGCGFVQSIAHRRFLVIGGQKYTNQKNQIKWLRRCFSRILFFNAEKRESRCGLVRYKAPPSFRDRRIKQKQITGTKYEQNSKCRLTFTVNTSTL